MEGCSSQIGLLRRAVDSSQWTRQEMVRTTPSVKTLLKPGLGSELRGEEDEEEEGLHLSIALQGSLGGFACMWVKWVRQGMGMCTWHVTGHGNAHMARDRAWECAYASGRMTAYACM